MRLVSLEWHWAHRLVFPPDFRFVMTPRIWKITFPPLYFLILIFLLKVNLAQKISARTHAHYKVFRLQTHLRFLCRNYKKRSLFTSAFPFRAADDYAWSIKARRIHQSIYFFANKTLQSRDLETKKQLSHSSISHTNCSDTNEKFLYLNVILPQQ